MTVQAARSNCEQGGSGESIQDPENETGANLQERKWRRRNKGKESTEKSRRANKHSRCIRAGSKHRRESKQLLDNIKWNVLNNQKNNSRKLQEN